jgi:hypothetical protein
LPGSSKYVANKFVGVLRSEAPACAVPSKAARLPRKKGGNGPPTTEAVGLPRGRAMTEVIVAGGRSRRNPRGYLSHRPKPVRNLHSPKPVEALPVDRLAVHRGGWSVDREEGASCPPAGVRCVPKHTSEGGVRTPRSPKRVGDSTNRRCLPKQVRSFRAGRRCLPKQVRATRAGVDVCRSRHRGFPRDNALGNRSCPGHRDRSSTTCRSRPSLVRPLSGRAG